MGRLAGKVAVITGAGSGMGRESARLFAAEGANVVLADVSGEEVTAATEIAGNAIAVHADISRAEDVRALIAAAVDTFGQLDVLFNNAAINHPHVPLHEIDDDFFDRLYAVNVRGVFLGIKYAVPAMRANGGGSIISTASAVGLIGRAGLAAYGATKGGVVSMTRSAALDYAGDNIRINAICPGFIFTGMAGNAADGSTPIPDEPMPYPIARWGLATEIAAAALFLASDDSSFVTGVSLPVDGGYTVDGGGRPR